MSIQSPLIVGIVVFTGFIFGEIATRIKLPKVTGYILAGILLNPSLLGVVPANFIGHTDLVTNIALSFITFSVGGTLLYSRVKTLGKSILSITISEAEFAFLTVTIGFLIFAPLIHHSQGTTLLAVYLPMSMLIGSLASPTDPSATLAVIHQYKAEGSVSSTIMGVAAFDDALGIINYSVATALSLILIKHTGFSVQSAIFYPSIVILGAVISGIAFGIFFNLITNFIKKESEGVLIVLILSILSLCFGVSKALGVDELLATMTMGVVVVNFNPNREKIFRILERYTEELIFVLFFTISGMHLQFSVLARSIFLVLLFVLFRAGGKFLGTAVGGAISNSPTIIRKYTAGGLIPQGGIVIGLALILKQNPAFDSISNTIISIIIGATVVHEIIGPIFSKTALQRAGEIAE
jgi:Kef-type K+ transport system membrane component KefB